MATGSRYSTSTAMPRNVTQDLRAEGVGSRGGGRHQACGGGAFARSAPNSGRSASSSPARAGGFTEIPESWGGCRRQPNRHLPLLPDRCPGGEMGAHRDDLVVECPALPKILRGIEGRVERNWRASTHRGIGPNIPPSGIETPMQQARDGNLRQRDHGQSHPARSPRQRRRHRRGGGVLCSEGRLHHRQVLGVNGSVM